MQNLICPVCKQPLKETGNKKSLHCDNGHLFDKAKQGHINLLLSHQKKSKHPGDTPEMVSARTRFLNKGYYQNVANKFVAIAQANSTAPKSSFINYCDIACGEGYYTQKLHQALTAKYDVLTTGFDISTPAVKAASKRDKSLQWLIASTNNTPIKSNSQEILSCLFCRVDFESASKIAKEDALFIVAETGRNHLIELRDHLYDEVKHEKSNKLPQDQPGFEFLESNFLTDKIELESSEDIIDLVTMTPHFWRVKPEKKEALAKIKSLAVSLDINFHLYRKDCK